LPPREGLTHNYYYYYRSLGEWVRLESPTDVDLYTRLFVPQQQAVTVIFQEEYESFLERLANSQVGPAPQGLDADAPKLTRVAEAQPVGGLPFAVDLRSRGVTRALVLLPGPWAACAHVAIRNGGLLFETELAPRGSEG
jgi:hypothetical protein